MAVHSSAIHSVGYVRSGQLLEIEFNSGEIYQYLGVSEQVFRELLRAPSKGRFFRREIRGVYEYKRVSGAA
jgi:hypothetical protein